MNTYNNIINITAKSGKTVSFMLSQSKKGQPWEAMVEKKDGTPIQYASAKTKKGLIELLNEKANMARVKENTPMNNRNNMVSATAQPVSTTRAIFVMTEHGILLLSAELDQRQLAIPDSVESEEFSCWEDAFLAAKDQGLVPFLVLEEALPKEEYYKFRGVILSTAQGLGIKAPRILVADEVTGALKFLWARASNSVRTDVGHPRGKGGVVLLLTPSFPEAHDLIMRACELLDSGEKVRILTISVAEKRFICDEIRNMGFKYLCPVAVWEKQLEEAN